MKKQASKFAALLMCGAMVLSLAACGDGGKKTEPTPTLRSSSPTQPERTPARQPA